MVGFGATSLAATVFFAKEHLPPFFHGLEETHVSALFIGTWPVVLLCWLVSFVAAFDLEVGVPRSRLSNSDPLVEIKRRKEEGARLRSAIERLGRPSLCWLACLACLLAPLTLQLLFLLVVSWPVDAHDCTGWRGCVIFGNVASRWVTASVLITWLPHVVLCLLARRLCASLHSGASVSIWRTSGAHLCLSASAVLPATILLAFRDGSPCLSEALGVTIGAVTLILFTGALFVPGLYWSLRRIHERESSILEAFCQPEAEPER